MESNLNERKYYKSHRGMCHLTDEFFRAFATLILWKEIQIFGFPWCSTREDLSIDVSITNVGLILTKLWWFLFSGYGQTDTVLESSHGNMSAHKKFQLKAQNYWLAVDPYMPPRRSGMHKKGDTIRSVCNFAIYPNHLQNQKDALSVKAGTEM